MRDGDVSASNDRHGGTAPGYPGSSAAGVGLRSTVLAAVCLALAVGPVATVGTVNDTPFAVPWWALAAAFCLAEVEVIPVRVRRSAHAFSLSEAPLVFGLFFSDPRYLVAAQVVGAAAALAVRRRRSPARLVGTVALLGLQAEVATLVFHAVPGGQHPDALTAWVLAFAGALAGRLVGVLIGYLAVALPDGRANLRRLPPALIATTVAATVDCSIGLVVTALLWARPGVLSLLVVPVVALFVAYRAYVIERQQHRRMHVLYASSRLLRRSADRDTDLLELLALVRSTFNVEYVELVVLPATADDLALRTALHRDHRVEVMEAVDHGSDVTRLVEGQHGVLVLRPCERGRELLAARGLSDAMAVALQGEASMVGTMLVGDRAGEPGGYDADDRTLFETLARQVAAALDTMRLERHLHRQAFHDSLTSLANRALFHDRVAHALAQRARGSRPLAILLLDLDDFKMVNDSLGHSAGDRLLVEVACRLLGCVRSCDTVARLGGDEFAVLLEDAAPNDAMTTARRILSAFREPLTVDGEQVPIRASVGIAASRAENTSVDKLLGRADVAMYHAKSRGKGRYELFDPGMQTAIVERHAMRAELERAADQQTISVMYQPFVDLRTGAVTAVEALARWRHPTRGLLPPSDFIPLAEDTGLIVPVGHAVLEQACRQASVWSACGGQLGRLSMSVNVSVRQFQHADFVDAVHDVLRSTGLAPSRLILEITESVMSDGSDELVDILRRLKALGVQLAIDDFGTGYSSLSALRRLPVDMLKIAKPFVDGVGVDGGQEAFTHAVLRLGATMDLRMVAEGVESRRQADWLRDLGCDLGQGFHFAPPLTVDAVESLLGVDGAPIRDIVVLPLWPAPRRRTGPQPESRAADAP